MNTFWLQGTEFVYFAHPYNGTRINERAVEVPVTLSLLRKAHDALEVGAVLPHYLSHWPAGSHTVVDLYEDYPAVINADILVWEPHRCFELIVSISTLDHLQNENEVCQAVRRMRSWLVPGGLLWITLPYGQPPEVGGGPWLDDLVTSGRLAPTALWRMDKVDALHHHWVQVEQDPSGSASIPPLAYHGASLFANTLYFLAFGPIFEWWRYESGC